MARLALDDNNVVAVRADNPGPLTLSGTNTWIIGAEPAWMIDPGPALDSHLDALMAVVRERGGLGGIALTHSHPDHAEGLAPLRQRLGTDVRVGAYAYPGTHPLRDGDRFGPLSVLELPGHAPDHVVFLADGIAFTGDAVLGEGSVFIAPDPGALAGYLAGLERLLAKQPRLIAPAHGPVVTDPRARIEGYISHRLEREQRLVSALSDGARSVEQLLDSAWSDVPAELRFAAAVTLSAHLDKLAGEGRLPAGVERPARPLSPDAS
ncbi:MAG: MBL fold metallo-hydrolase [Solirubrobacterales bacterium]|nr:MBL fold metallo-hydrolase [Solirubrobacterales bacterium]